MSTKIKNDTIISILKMYSLNAKVFSDISPHKKKYSETALVLKKKKSASTHKNSRFGHLQRIGEDRHLRRKH